MGYYLPFYFQAVEGVSPTASGVRFIALAFPEVLAIVIMGVIVTKTGLYVRSCHFLKILPLHEEWVTVSLDAIHDNWCGCCDRWNKLAQPH